VVSPGALGAAGTDPANLPDRQSAAYLVAVAARAISEIGRLLRGARRAGQQLPTLTIDATVRFATPADRAAFADEIAGAVRRVVARHHDEAAEVGRTYRLVVLSHPCPPKETPDHE
jgi:hypothetical protein